MTDAKAKLGDMIFDDKRVSSDDSVACNTCHSPRNGFTTHTETSRGVGYQLGKRNAPSLLNAMRTRPAGVEATSSVPSGESSVA